MYLENFTRTKMHYSILSITEIILMYNKGEKNLLGNQRMRHFFYKDSLSGSAILKLGLEFIEPLLSLLLFFLQLKLHQLVYLSLIWDETTCLQLTC